MSCNKCSTEAKYFCSCSEVLICSNHIEDHIGHSIEVLDKTLTISDSHALKSELLKRLSQLETTKKNICSVIRHLIPWRKEENDISSGKALIIELKQFEAPATTKLTSLIQKYTGLLSQSSFSTSQNTEIKRLISTDLIIKEISQMVSPENSQLFSGELVSEKIKEELKSVIEAEERKERQKKIQNMKKIGQKIKYLRSLNLEEHEFIEDYEIKEIKFSNDIKYAFVCKNYSEDHSVESKNQSECRKLYLVNIYNLETKKCEWEDDHYITDSYCASFGRTPGIDSLRARYPECIFKDWVSNGRYRGNSDMKNSSDSDDSDDSDDSEDD